MRGGDVGAWKTCAGSSPSPLSWSTAFCCVAIARSYFKQSPFRLTSNMLFGNVATSGCVYLQHISWPLFVHENLQDCQARRMTMFPAWTRKELHLVRDKCLIINQKICHMATYQGLKIRRLPERGRTGSIPVSGTRLPFHRVSSHLITPFSLGEAAFFLSYVHQAVP